MLTPEEAEELRAMVLVCRGTAREQLGSFLDPACDEQARQSATTEDADQVWQVFNWIREHTDGMQPDASVAGHGVQGETPPRAAGRAI